MGGKSWTGDEKSRARQMILLGFSDYAIAERFGRTRSAVRNLRSEKLRYSLKRTCSGCPTPVRDDNKTGRCKICATVHNNRLPRMIEARKVGWKKRLANPIHYAALCRVAAANSRKAMADPVKRARAVETALAIYAKYLDTPEMRARLADPEVQLRKGRKITAQRLAWCPPEYRADYLHLINSKCVKAADARPMILAQIKADLAKLSPFERQERALAKGAALVANDSGPSFGEATDYGEARWTA